MFNLIENNGTIFLTTGYIFLLQKFVLFFPLLILYFPKVLVIIDVKPKDLGLPTEAYISVEEVHDVSPCWSY